MTFDDILKKYRAESFSEHDKGSRFEVLMKNFLLTYPQYRNIFSDVWLWKDFPYKNDFGGKDLGIDIVAKTFDGEFYAVQCKCYAESSTIDKPAVDSFLATSSKIFQNDKKFSNRIWISTTNNFTDNAEKTLQNQSPPVSVISLTDLQNAAVDWDKLNAGIFGNDARKNSRELRNYQIDAINAAYNYFQKNSRGKLIMACGTGKTFTSLKIAEKLCPNGKILFLVPSLSLIKQTLNEWTIFSTDPIKAVCVCGDKTVAANDDIQNVNLPIPVTNNPQEISAAVNKSANFGMTVIFSTYQSIEKVIESNLNFDLTICDEAHRTAGNSQSDKESKLFSLVHDNSKIISKLRIYMTATPKLYGENVKNAAKEKNLTVWSMDDENIFGEEFFKISFKQAIKLGCLSDYRLLIFAVNEGEIQNNMRSEIQNLIEEEIKNKKIKISFSVDEIAKLVGTINALSKRVTEDSKIFLEDDLQPMNKAIAFLPKIVDSKVTAFIFDKIEEIYKKSLKSEESQKLIDIQAEHVDGSINSEERKKILNELEKTPQENCTIISNVRCLSEGVDVPSLDAVIFLTPKKSKIDIIQAIGRALRTAKNKKFGYIIVPIIVPSVINGEIKKYFDSNNEKYQTIYEVARMLGAYDDTMNIEIERLQSTGKSEKIKILRTPEFDSQQIDLPFEIFQTELIAQVVNHAGNKNYWIDWAQKVSVIVQRHTQRIKSLISEKNSPPAILFQKFVEDLQKIINPSVSENDAIDILAQHLVTRPIFDALFDDNSFAKNNPVSIAMQNILAELDKDSVSKDNEIFDKLYDQVREQCRDMGDAKKRQEIIIKLYDSFFRLALPKTSEKLGIVYTPVEVVDFILNSVNDILQKNFNKKISDIGVDIIDPFTGTGTFITRIIENFNISAEKFQNELHANEIVLLAYYIAAINIENSFSAISKIYQPFNGICFTDTFQTFEDDDRNALISDNFEKISERIKNQISTNFQVIIGNPPYSVGQKSANDNNQNNSYKKLEQRISETYAKNTVATNKNSLYDSYIKAFRWASDRISSGIIGFVTNSGWIDGAAMDGLRKCFYKEFSEIYIFNLRGNARTQGEIRQKESGNIFGSGSRAPIAITILVKNPKHVGNCEIFYLDIGDYLSREEKLLKITEIKTVLNEKFTKITPNDKGDWINQRGNEFEKYILLGDKKNKSREVFFEIYSTGLQTNRDQFIYNFSQKKLSENIQTTIKFFNENSPDNVNDKKIIWTRATKQNKLRGKKFFYFEEKIFSAMYRPFCEENFYYDENLIEVVGTIKKFFPTGNAKNLLICISTGEKDFSVFITKKIPDRQFQFNGQCFPLYYYDLEEGNLFEKSEMWRYGISDWVEKLAQKKYGLSVRLKVGEKSFCTTKSELKEEIFYYVYGFLHLKSYREKFSAELKKSLPRIILVDRYEDFKKISECGRRLAEIHLNYEKFEKPPEVEVIIEKNNFYVKKMRLSADKKTLRYNEFITIKNIPAKVFEYVVNGRSPLEWVIERYQIKVDKASGIENNPNDYCEEIGDEKYILKLLLSVMTVAIKTLEIVENLPEVEFGT